MSRISNTDKYPSTPDIKDEDIVLGSKGNDKKTKNFKFSDIGEYVKRFFGKSNEEIPSFDSHVFGVTPEGKVIKIPVTEFQGTLIGSLEGNYGDLPIEYTTSNQDYL